MNFMKSALILSTMMASLIGHEIEIVRDYLQPTAIEWRASVSETYPNGSAKIVYYYEDRDDGQEIAVKRVSLLETGQIVANEDLEGDKSHGLSAVYYP